MQRYIYFALVLTFTGYLTVTGQSPPTCPFPSEVVTYYPVPENCSMYWECYRGSGYLMSCPNGTRWSMEEITCDFPKNVNCSENSQTTTSTPIPTIPIWTPDPLCPYPSDGMSFFPHPDCTKYYQCYKGSKFVMSCPINLYWNQDEKSCGPRENSTCE